MPGYAAAVADWLDETDLRSIVLIGHSSGTQVAARAALLRPDRAAALVLASPTVDPAYRGWLRVLYRWRRDSRFPNPGLAENHRPEWKRAGPRQIRHLISVHLRDRLEDVVDQLDCRVLVIRGEQDGLLTGRWAEELADRAADGALVHVPGPHAFFWRDPAVWSEPIVAGQFDRRDPMAAGRSSGIGAGSMLAAARLDHPGARCRRASAMLCAWSTCPECRGRRWTG